MTASWRRPARRLPKIRLLHLIAFGALACSRAGADDLGIGRLRLHACGAHRAFCGTLERPLDPTGGVGGSIGVHFELYRHRARGAALSMLVATEGGPGYPATASRDAYLALFAPLLDTHDLLLMDNRGTGKSGAVDCAPLQQAERQTVELNGACGQSLGERAPLYSTAYATDDLAAIIGHLGIEKIDLYGDSYGTFFEQAFALRHPALLRSIVLDGAYPLAGPDYAWYPTYALAMRDKFDRVCQRAPDCARLAGTSLSRAQAVLDLLRAEPFEAEGYDSDGRLRRFRADPSMLATVMFASAPALVTARDFDAAARAFVQGDRAPLLRLMAETAMAVDSRDPSGDATQFSAGLAIAVMCQDSPQIFDMRLPVPARRIDRDRALAQRIREMPDTYAPFSIDEYRGIPLDYGFIEQCIEWPAPAAAHPPGQVAPPQAPYPATPALILSGDLDNITTPQDGAAVAAAFPQGHQVLLANSFHVNALPHARSDCGADIVRRFVQTLQTGDIACADEVPPLRLPPVFATRSEAIDPLQAMAGNQASAASLRVAAVALQTAADVLARLPANTSGRGVGLRGGEFLIDSLHGHRLRLHEVRWSEDVAISGSIDVGEGRRAPVTAHLHVRNQEDSGELTLRWISSGGPNEATVRGRWGGALLAARAPAP